MEPEVIGSIVTSGVSLVIAFFSWLTSFLYKRKSSAELQKAVSDNISERMDEAYIVCPNCSSKVSVDDCELYFPVVQADSKVALKEVVNNGKAK